MKKITISVLAVLILLTSVIPVLCFAKAPDKGSMISSDIVKMDFVHYARSSKPGGVKSDPGYKLMGVKWPAGKTVTYTINPINPEGLSTEFILNTISISAETWDNATGAELFNNSYTIDITAAYGVSDSKNSIVFGLYPGNSSVIAVTSVWFNRKTKAIVEFDMLFNTYYAWGNADMPVSGIMDLQNIATHELGHSVGLSDIYSNSFSFVTMYGYSSEGDTAKRSLEAPDITGLQVMYGQ